jgi:hypothetical protein
MATADHALPMPSEIFDECFPLEAQRVAVSVVVDAYARAHEECEAMFQPPERSDVSAIVRRGFIEQDLRDAMTREKLTAAAVKNSKGTSSHTRVTAGRVVLTESCVHSVNEMVRDAEFRSAYSATPQLLLLEENLVDDDGAVYAILIHGPHPEFADQPGFVHVVFPSPNLEYYQDQIDLLGRFPEVVARLRGWEPREEIDPSESAPRKDRDVETRRTDQGR